ncbi:BACK domain-containing protein [Plasmodiophora brassicae]
MVVTRSRSTRAQLLRLWRQLTESAPMRITNGQLERLQDPSSSDCRSFKRFLLGLVDTADPAQGLGRVAIYKTCLDLGYHDLYPAIIKAMAQHFEETMAEEEFPSLPDDDMFELVSSGWVWVPTESALVAGIWTWVHANPTARLRFSGPLLDHVNWGRWTATDMETVADRDLARLVNERIHRVPDGSGSPARRWRCVQLRVPIPDRQFHTGEKRFRMGPYSWHARLYATQGASTVGPMWYKIRLTLEHAPSPGFETTIVVALGSSTSQPLAVANKKPVVWTTVGHSVEMNAFPIHGLGQRAANLVVDGALQCELLLSAS